MIFLLYIASFIITSAFDAFWHLVLFGKQYALWFQPVAKMQNGMIALNGIAGVLSQILVVASIFFLVLYKTNGHPKLLEGAMIGAVAGILGISVYGLVNYALINHWGIEMTILEVVWGPILGALSGMCITLLTNKFLH